MKMHKNIRWVPAFEIQNSGEISVKVSFLCMVVSVMLEAWMEYAVRAHSKVSKVVRLASQENLSEGVKS